MNIGQEDFGEWLTIRQIRQLFPTKIFHIRYQKVTNSILHALFFPCVGGELVTIMQLNNE